MLSTCPTKTWQQMSCECARFFLKVSNGNAICQLVYRWNVRIYTMNDHCYNLLMYILVIYILYVVVRCTVLSRPSNGQYTYSGWNYNDNVNFSCNTGYLLRGNSSRTCLSNGQWSGTQTLCAIGEYIYTLLCIHSNTIYI